MKGVEAHHHELRRRRSSRRCTSMVQMGLISAILMFVLVSTEFEGVVAWSKEGHVITCRIAQELLEPEAEAAVKELLPESVNGELASVCGWPDQIRIFHKYRWSSPLHYIVTPDRACNFDYQRDCLDDYGNEDMCVAGAILNFTSQLQHYNQPTTSHHHQYNLTEALIFLSHFVGDIHQPLHTGFEGDEGGNTIALRWFRRKSNLHHVWDRDIIVTAIKEYYDNDLELVLDDIHANFTHGTWAKDVPSWMDCDDLYDCVNNYATESVKIACKQAYKGAKSGVTLSDKYFNTRLPFVMKRIAQGGIRLAMILNDVFSDDRGQENVT